MNMVTLCAKGFTGNRMVTTPTETTWQGLFKDSSWRGLSGPAADSKASRLGAADISQVRQIVSLLFGADARVFVREKPATGKDGSVISVVHLMVECARVLPERLSAQTSLIERLQKPLAGRRTRVLLVDPSFTLTEEHKRFRFVAMEY